MQAAIAYLAVSSRQPSMVAAATEAIASLDAMARREGCGACAVEATLARAQDALTRREPDEAQRLLRDVEARLAQAPPEVAQHFHYSRARLYNIHGNFSGGIAEALKSSDLAEKAGDEASRIRAQALMVP